MSHEAEEAPTVTVNGETMNLPAAATVDTLVAQILGAAGAAGIAVAVDGTVIPRSQWSTTVIPAGVAVELVTATQGG